ncbi:heavy metal translocating P-type ATPase [Deinococcus sp.]|uniref:heavy metal translocating P-type ATPase n=1 Tax=Deinococcus sp. TaxID=47478 RepID=UPI0025BA9B42|nr:heavy metal translocating P-type ATPase [Deinococcus sp.]
MSEPTAAHRGETLTYFVEGMDCANCVQKVERLVGRLPGTGEVRTSFSRQTLQLHLDETQTPRQSLESHLRSLGYVPTLRSAAAQARPPQHDHPEAGHTGQDHLGHGHSNHNHSSHEKLAAGTPWFRGTQGRLVLVSGTLLALAWILSLSLPALGYAGFAAATLLGVWPLARKAFVSARLGDLFSIELLVTLAGVGALLIGQAAEGAVVVFLFALGELLEGVAAGRARAGIQALAALAPKTALLLEPGGVREVPADALRVGQRVQVNPGGRVPADGLIVAGTSHLDDSPVTGESMPVSKVAGDRVYAGSINTDGTLTVRVEKEAADNTIARIIHLVEEAEEHRAPTARLIDRFSRWYTPGVVLVAALVALVPPLLFGQPWPMWLYKGLALLLIGCPCALVLSVPAAITSAIGAGARRGLLIKGGAVLERVGIIKTVAFDKTGTLTAGRPRMTDILAGPLPGTVVERSEVLRLAAAVESGSSHPLGRAVVAEAQAAQLTVPTAAGAKALPGQGVSAVVEGRTLWVSSPAAAGSVLSLPNGLLQSVEVWETEGKTAVVLHDGSSVLGVLALRDEPRPDARAALARLARLGVSTVMLTGDNPRTAQAIAADLGIQAQAGLLPADKLRIISELGKRGGVAMVGDGINDAPALARADVGVAMGSGTDVALETADAALLRDRVGGVAELIALSRDTMTNIRWNIGLALGLKAIFLVTTLLGYTNLWMAVLADTGATALVTANALRLLRWHGGRAGGLDTESPETGDRNTGTLNTRGRAAGQVSGAEQ